MKTEIKCSIIIPTYKEVNNIRPLTERICKVMKNESFEILIVDDNSSDGTEEQVRLLSKKYPIRIIVRTQERGLSSAVLRGFDEAKGNLLICMDADLQHPPEKVPELLKALETSEFVIGTRYKGANSVDKDWPLYRRVISSGARLLAMHLTPLSDPMTGFFGIQRYVLDRGKHVSPIGFKIAMELFVKTGVRQHKEIPIQFGLRTAGESKLNSKMSEIEKLLLLLESSKATHPKNSSPATLKPTFHFDSFKAFHDEKLQLVKSLMRKQEKLIDKMMLKYDLFEKEIIDLQQKLQVEEMITGRSSRSSLLKLLKHQTDHVLWMQSEMSNLVAEQQEKLSQNGFPLFDGVTNDPETLALQHWILAPYVAILKNSQSVSS